MSIVIQIIFGLGIGLVSGLIGIGGGAMLVPLFVFLFKMNMYKAVGTSLAVIAPITLVGAISHHMKGNVDLSSVLVVAVGAMIGIFVSGQVIEHIPAVYLRRGFAIFLIIIAVKLLMKS